MPVKDVITQALPPLTSMKAIPSSPGEANEQSYKEKIEKLQKELEEFKEKYQQCLKTKDQVYMQADNETLQFYVDSLEQKLSAEKQLRATIEEQMEVQRKTNGILQKSVRQLMTDKINLKAKISRLQKQLKSHKIKLTFEEKKEAVRDVLRPYWSETSINWYLRSNAKKVKKWEERDLKFAISLRCISKKAYMFIKKANVMPLPGLSTLRRNFADFKLRPGYLEAVDEILRLKASGMVDMDKVVVISFDEIYLRKDISYDSVLDQVIGPFSAANVAMIQGVTKNFKYPIWYRYNTKMSPEELKDLVKKVEDMGFHVIGIVSDMDGANRSVPEKLGASLTTPRFPNPARPGQYVYYMYDQVHILKLIRTHLVRTGFWIGGELIGGPDIFEEFISKLEESKSDIRVAPKLTRRHISFENQDSQSVRLACELISSTTAEAMVQLFPDSPEFKKLSDLIKLLDT